MIMDVGMVNLDDVYAPELLEKAANITHIGRLKDPDASAEAHSKLCGSTITVDLNMREGRVSEYAQEVEACLLGQSAAAIMAENVIGTGSDELKQVAGQMKRMLKEEGEPPTGKWSDLALLENVRHFRARHASTLLVFDAVVKAIEEIEAKEAA